MWGYDDWNICRPNCGARGAAMRTERQRGGSRQTERAPQARCSMNGMNGMFGRNGTNGRNGRNGTNGVSGRNNKGTRGAAYPATDTE